MEKYDVVAMGELLIDFTQNGYSEQGNPIFEANPGGAPCNVLAMLQKLGRKTAFIGKVGQDGFGLQLEKALKETGISTEGLCFDKEVHTTLAVVQKKEDGDRDFSFYRKPGADMMLRKEEVKEELIRNAKIFHYGSLSLTDEPVRTATVRAIEAAEKAGIWISFDPNLRKPLWESEELAKEQIRYGLGHCNILKISDDELVWFTGEQDYEKAIQQLRVEFQIPLILLSLGKAGSRAYCGEERAEVPAFLNENTLRICVGVTFNERRGRYLYGLYAASDFEEGISKPDQTGHGRNAYFSQRGRLHHYHQKRRTSSHAGRRGDFKTNYILRKWRLL